MARVAVKAAVAVETKAKPGPVNARGQMDTPRAEKAKADEAAAKAGETGNSIIVLKKGALSTDVGPRVIAAFSKTIKDEQDAQATLTQVGAKRYELQTQLTLAIVKAAKADTRVDLSVAFGKDVKATGALFDTLGVALGFREVITTNDERTGVAFQRVQTAKAVFEYFPKPGEDIKTAEGRRKETARSNFMHRFKQCTQAACAIVDKEITASVDKSGTLVVSGPAIKQEFGQDKVTVNEKKVIGEGDAAVELHSKPSFTALAAMGAAEHNATIHRGSNTRGTMAPGAGEKATENAAPKGNINISSSGAIVQIAKALTSAIEKHKEPFDKAILEGLESVRNAIDIVLANHVKAPAAKK